MKSFSLKRSAVFFALISALFVSACASTTAVIPDDISPAELIQRAQEASDKNRYTLAFQYYQAVLERNPANIDLVCTAEYEIAFIHYKQKKYTQATEEFQALLTRYDTPDEELLPQQFKRLSTIVLERIAEKERPANFFGTREKKKS
jgi:outer membrane protein assembly factor BamD (BamD/ComL family)